MTKRTIVQKARLELFDSLGWLLCELAFRAHCWGPFAYAYRAGCWFYEKADEPERGQMEIAKKIMERDAEALEKLAKT